MRRVSIIGNSGSGKSTLGAALAARLGVEFLEVDSVYHQAGWQPLPEDQFRARIAELAARDGWVIDGSYSAVRELAWPRADTIVWLDLPRRVVMRQIIGRTLRRVARRAELWNGNRERWRNFFSLDEEQSVIVWSWRNHGRYRARFAAVVTDHPIVRLRSRREVAAFLAEAQNEAQSEADTARTSATDDVSASPDGSAADRSAASTRS
jgi:adenylate kinase family enzyme